MADDDAASLKHEIAFRLALQAATEEQRVDVVRRPRSRAPTPIDEIASAQAYG